MNSAQQPSKLKVAGSNPAGVAPSQDENSCEIIALKAEQAGCQIAEQSGTEGTFRDDYGTESPGNNPGAAVANSWIAEFEAYESDEPEIIAIPAGALTFTALIAAFRIDPASHYHACRYRSRRQTDNLCRIIETEIGALPIMALRTRDILGRYRVWTQRGIPMAHALMTQLRTLCSFGASILENDDCAKLSVRLHTQRFPQGKPRDKIIDRDMVLAISRVAHAADLHSIALMQKMQFELTLRQKDLLGEWMPKTEPCRNYLVVGDMKWWYGARWEEVDTNLILTHTTSKRGKVIVVDLKNAPLTMGELYDTYGLMSDLPRRGPIIVYEETGLPWSANIFRRRWREIARKAGIPDDVNNQDTRAGAITEALSLGIPIDKVRKTAAHTEQSMTARYSRGDQDEIAEVMKLRAAASR